MPLAAFLVLFDLVIDNPTHPETATNIAILDVGSGHFSRIEYASQGTLPGSIISEFAHIARAYVREHAEPERERTRPDSAQQLETYSSQPQLEDLSEAASDAYSNDWNFQGGEGGLGSGMDIMDLFGSYIPNWDEDWMNGINTTM